MYNGLFFYLENAGLGDILGDLVDQRDDGHHNSHVCDFVDRLLDYRLDIMYGFLTMESAVQYIRDGFLDPIQGEK